MPWFIPNDPEQGVYRFILASAKRARQLQAGARPLISTTSRKPTKIAMEEVRTGAVEAEMNASGTGGPKASYAALDLPTATPESHVAPRSSAVVEDKA
ncbi:MAG: DNA-directed RNA polymerase subunit omega [Acidobacteria bacterium]|nr:DNA-directed RNA polymerase subunit omega [Acidobacteriota bacterium]